MELHESFDPRSAFPQRGCHVVGRAVGAVEVAWQFDGVMSQFQIEYKLSSAGSYTEQVVPGFNRRFTIRGLTTGQTYNFRIKSVSTADSSSSFATANITL